MNKSIKKRIANYFFKDYRKIIQHENICFGQEGEDLILDRIFNNIQTGFFVDVGALHPKRFSNTYLFYKRGWTGLNIEPNPDIINVFNEERTKDININCGIGKKEGLLTYYSFDEPALNTFSKKLMEVYRAIPKYNIIKQIKIEIYRLETILDKNLIENQQINFMSVDTEGFDLDVLESNNWNKYRPKIVLVEDLDFKDYQMLKSPISVFMESVNYQFFAKTVNTVFFKDKTQI